MMLGINKRLDQIEYRLARIDKMLEDMLTVPKQIPSVVVHKPVSDTRQRKTDWYPSGMAEYMRTRYRTVDDIIAKFGYTQESVRTYIKNIRKAGLTVVTRGRAPTQYKIYNPHNKGAKSNG
jgi:hypothetical protein